MVKVSVLYGHPESPEAFEDYYANKHMPLAAGMPHVQRVELNKVLGTPGGEAPKYYRTAHLYFASMEDLQASFGSEEGQAVAQDIANFATGGAEVMFSEVQGD